MFGMGYLKFFLLKRARVSYNSSNFLKSLRYSRVMFIFFNDRDSLDLLARSNLRLKKYQSAAKYYKKAEKYGYILMDHDLNKFVSELKSENFIGAYSSLKKLKNKREYDSKLRELIVGIKKLSDSEIVVTIQDLEKIHDIPEKLKNLLPWSSKEVDFDSNSSGSKFTPLSKDKMVSERYKREIVRLQHSGSYKVANFISKSIRKPFKAIILPMTLPFFILNIIRKKTGKLPNHIDSNYSLSESSNNRNSIIFFPTNGVGFGHFTRLLAIAKQIRKTDSEIEIVFFTTMPTLNILAAEGFPCYYVPGRYRYEDMDPSTWNSICEEMLNLVFTIHKPKAFIFDGAYPYRGMLNALQSYSNNILKVWIRRGSIKKKSSNIPIDSFTHFHAVIRPGDSMPANFDDEFDNAIPLIKTNPIILFDSIESGQSSLRERLGIPKLSIVCYLQLGAGKINDTTSELNITIEELIKHPHIYVVIGESLIGDQIKFSHPRVRNIREYPNSKYFNDIDFAIVAGGYNTYHELIEFNVPSICYPNFNTGRDDQLARTELAENNKSMIVIRNRNKINISIAISKIIDDSTRKDMKLKLKSLKRSNGAKDAAKWILDAIN